MTICTNDSDVPSNDSTSLVASTGPQAVTVARKNPKVREVVRAGGRVGHSIKAAAAEVVIRGVSMALLPLYGPLAEERHPEYLSIDSSDILFLELVTAVIGFFGTGFAAMGFGSAQQLAAAIGLPETVPGGLEVLAIGTLAGPALIGGITGLIIDFRAAKACFDRSPLVQRLGDMEIPLDRILGPGKPPQLKR